MISVDIFVPILDKTYDFSLSEDAQVGAVIEEIAEMISQKEHWAELATPEKLILSCPQLKRVLRNASTLGQSGVTTGATLILT